MKNLIFATLLFLNFIFCSFAKEKKISEPSYNFIQREAVKSKKEKRFNEYQDIWSGGLSLLIGTIGYYSTNNKILQLSYSGIQTLGIINLGTAAYDYYNPNLEYDIYTLTRNIDQSPKVRVKDKVATDLIKHLAESDRALRYRMLITTSLLAAQYYSNAFIDEPHKDLKGIYTFLGVVNTIVATYSYFYRSKYEKFYFEKKKPIIVKLIPDIQLIEENNFLVSWSFEI